jgi:Response regulator of the LytR/AlgR family
MRIAICDDDPSELQLIQKTVQMFIESNRTNAEFCLNMFTSGSDLLDFANHSLPFDFLILDIIMPGINGIELAAEIRTKNKECKILFLTSSPEFALHSYKVDAFYYLLKPFDQEELLALLNKAFLSMQEDRSKSLVIKEKTNLRRIHLHTIAYVESIKHTLNFHLRDGDAATCYAKMGEFEELLLSDKRFILCHRSFIVNMICINKVTNKYFILSDKTIIPISRSVYLQVKQSYFNFFFEKGAIV